MPEQQKVLACGKRQSRAAQDFAMSDLSPILVLQIKICIKPDRHGKGSNKIWETLSFWRNFFNNGAIWLQALICNRLNPWYGCQSRTGTTCSKVSWLQRPALTESWIKQWNFLFQERAWEKNINFANDTEDHQQTERISPELANGYRPEYAHKDNAVVCSDESPFIKVCW